MSDRTHYSQTIKLLAAIGTTLSVSLCYLYNKSKKGKKKPKSKNEKTNKTEIETRQKLIDVLNLHGKIKSELFDFRDNQTILLRKFDNIIIELQEKNKILEKKVKQSSTAICYLKESFANTHNTLLSNNVRLQKIELRLFSFFDNQETVLPHLTGLTTIHDNQETVLPHLTGLTTIHENGSDILTYFTPRRKKITRHDILLQQLNLS